MLFSMARVGQNVGYDFELFEYCSQLQDPGARFDRTNWFSHFRLVFVIPGICIVNFCFTFSLFSGFQLWQFDCIHRANLNAWKSLDFYKWLCVYYKL